VLLPDPSSITSPPTATPPLHTHTHTRTTTTTTRPTTPAGARPGGADHPLARRDRPLAGPARRPAAAAAAAHCRRARPGRRRGGAAAGDRALPDRVAVVLDHRDVRAVGGPAAPGADRERVGRRLPLHSHPAGDRGRAARVCRAAAVRIRGPGASGPEGAAGRRRQRDRGRRGGRALRRPVSAGVGGLGFVRGAGRRSPGSRRLG